MYDIHSSSQEVMLWTYFQNHDSLSETSKRPCSAEDDNTSGAPATKVTRSEAISDKLKEVDEIVQQLSSKHEATGKYTLEQLRTWAHLIQMNIHQWMYLQINPSLASLPNGSHLMVILPLHLL